MNKFIDIKQNVILQFYNLKYIFQCQDEKKNTNMKLMKLHMLKMHMFKSETVILHHANSFNKQRIEN